MDFEAYENFLENLSSVMRGWYESPIEAIKAAKRRNATAANIVVALYIPKEK